VLRFGIFELDEAAGELRRNGSVVRLPPQPFQVLLLLAHNAGEVVDRDRIRREIWGDTAVDFDRSLNVCIAQVRSALNDDADSPRFVQTLPRRGYRFLASIERPVAAPMPAPPVEQVPRRRWTVIALGVAVVAALAGVGYRLWPAPDPAVRLAVLPFDTVGLPGGDTPQIDGLFDELLTRLGGVQPDRLQVIGRRSVTVFRGARKPLREIGERLHVGYALEATVRTEGDRLRLAVRLAQTGNEALLWSESFAQDADPGAFEEDVVARVSAGVLTKLFPGASPPAREPACRDGWEAYRTGRLLANRGSAADLEKSLTFFEQARCAAGRAAEAEVLVRLAKFGLKRPDLWDRARAAAREALQLNGNAEGAHLSLANVAFWKDWDWKSAEREFQTALRRHPSDPDAHHDYAWLLVALGRRSEGLASLQRAIALDPLSARVNMDAGWLLLQAGRFREAAAQASRALELNPEMAEARACMARALLYAGDDRAALEALTPLLKAEERQSVTGLSARQAMRKLFQSSIKAKGSMDPYQRAWRLAWVGAGSEALDDLEEAFRRHSVMMPLVASDPAFASIRKDPRFLKVVRGMGL
jgi:DNA-binding winged helix-turn-helix (wHTH) protein/TolB-like protein/Tfp pilus assembly protein PilF